MGWEVGAWGEGWLHFCLAFLFTPGGRLCFARLWCWLFFSSGRFRLCFARLWCWLFFSSGGLRLCFARLWRWLFFSLRGASALLRSPLVERGEELAATPQCIRETFGFPNRGLRPGKIQSGKFSCKQEICHLVFWHCSLPSRTL